MLSCNMSASRSLLPTERKTMQRYHILLAALLGTQSGAHAALIDRGNGLIYDSSRNITWLQDANLAKTSGFDDDGRMTWDEAMNWASALDFSGYSDWRLPLGGSDTYSNEQLSVLYFNDLSISDPGAFINIQPATYWSGTPFGGVSGYVWAFNYELNGVQGWYPQYPQYSWAVRDGDVSPIPEPSSSSLIAAGVLLAAAFRWNRSR